MEAVRGKKAEYKAVSTTGIQKYNARTNLRHFDVEEGVAHYDPDRRVCGFKMGPMRLVQFAIMQDVISFYRQNPSAPGDLLFNMPANTADKLFYFEAEGAMALHPIEVKELVDSYNYFLWFYHKQQEAFERLGSTELLLNRPEVRERLHSIAKIIPGRILNTK